MALRVRKKRHPEAEGRRRDRALLAALVVALVAGLFGAGFGSSYVELVSDYASCSSGERSYMASTSLAEAAYVLFMVDDLEDRHQRDGFNRVPPSRGAKCIAMPTAGPHVRSTCGKTGRCTLRAALEEAASIDRHTPVTIQLRGGNFMLAAPLPDFTGSVHIVGLEPGSWSGSCSWSAALVGGDGGWPQPLSKIGIAPEELATAIDGGGKVQVLRTAPLSRLHLQDLRVENGVALVTEKGGDPRLGLGGGVNALGALVLTNTVVRGNRAINGACVAVTQLEFAPLCSPGGNPAPSTLQPHAYQLACKPRAIHAARISAGGGLYTESDVEVRSAQGSGPVGTWTWTQP